MDQNGRAQPEVLRLVRRSMKVAQIRGARMGDRL